MDAAIDGPPAVDSGRPGDSGHPSDAGAADAAFVTAAHPRLPVVQEERGTPLMNPRVTSVTFAGSTYEDAISDLDAFVSGVVPQPFWAAATAEYGIGTTTVEPPQHLAEAAPGVATADDIRAWLAAKIQSGAPGFADATGDSLFVVYYPISTTLELSNLTSCTGFGGYHDSAPVALEGGTIYPAFAAVPECPVSGTGVIATLLENTTSAAVHEMVEAVTDPHADHLGGSPPYPGYAGTAKGSWSFDQYAAWSISLFGYYGYIELADMCADFDDSYFTPTGFPYMVQRSWSNQAALAGRDPCVPYTPSAGPYFLAQPVFDPAFATDEVPVPPIVVPLVGFQVQIGDAAVPDQTQGLHIAPGTSATLPIVLWSEAPVADWAVSVIDPFNSPLSPYLSMSLDKSTGNNGDVLHLTIEVKAVDATFGGHPFWVVSNDGTHQHVSMGFVSSS